MVGLFCFEINVRNVHDQANLENRDLDKQVERKKKNCRFEANSCIFDRASKIMGVELMSTKDLRTR